MDKLGIYIHFPFCESKCNYCDFISYAQKREQIPQYVEAVLQEITLRASKEKKEISSIYLGGGTPSYIESSYIKKIVQKLKETFLWEPSIEVTIEVNPGTITKQKLMDYINCGINRISMGLQETHDNLLKEIGRIHTYEQFLEGYHLAKEVGFDNMNVDLMIGLPGQTVVMVEESLQRLIALEPQHISIYSLIIEEGTRIEKKIAKGEFKLPEETIERQMYDKVKSTLEQNGYVQYEISNFAKPGYISRHNWDCWNQEEYLGIGVAAHSYEEQKRYSHTASIEKYIEAMAKGNLEEITQIEEIQNKQEMQKEYMMLGLRKIEGIKISEFKQKFSENPLYLYRKELEKLVKEKLIEVDGDFVLLTRKGLDLANLVWEEFV